MCADITAASHRLKRWHQLADNICLAPPTESSQRADNIIYSGCYEEIQKMTGKPRKGSKCDARFLLWETRRGPTRIWLGIWQRRRDGKWPPLSEDGQWWSLWKCSSKEAAFSEGRWVERIRHAKANKDWNGDQWERILKRLGPKGLHRKTHER